MRCIVLQNSRETPLGFLLSSTELSEPAGDCVFMLFPGGDDPAGEAEALLLEERAAAGESVWEITGRDPWTWIVRTPGFEAGLFVAFDGPESGEWGVVEEGARRVLGRAGLPPNR